LFDWLAHGTTTYTSVTTAIARLNRYIIIVKKNLFYCSLSINIILATILLALFSRPGLIDIVKENISKIININTNTVKAQTPNRYRVGYYKMRKTMLSTFPISKGAIVFLGDSLTDQGEWNELLKNCQIVNRGISGDTTEGVFNRLDRITKYKPRKIFLMIGVNDLWNESKTIPEIINNYQKNLEFIQQKSPQTQVFIESLLPINNRSYQIAIDNRDIITVNQELKKLAEQFSCQYLNLHDRFLNDNGQLDVKYTMDGVHLTTEGYLLWAKSIEPYVRK
jgi:lysophospholipase L1-like esterase